MRILCLGILLAASLPAADVLESLKEADRQFAAETATRGLEGWLNHFADDARVNTHQGVIVGKPALRQYYSRMFAQKDFSIRWTPLHAEASKDETLGYTIGEATISWITAEGKPESRPGRYLSVWRKQPDGSWKVAIDQGN